MHKSTKLPESLRREVFRVWKKNKLSLRQLALLYHVDKRVIQRVLERGKLGDFTVHSSANLRYQKKTARKKPNSPTKLRK